MGSGDAAAAGCLSSARVACDGERCSGARKAWVSGDGGREDERCDAADRGGDCGGESVDGCCADAVLHHAGVPAGVLDVGGRKGSVPASGAERVAGSGGRACAGPMLSVRTGGGACACARDVERERDAGGPAGRGGESGGDGSWSEPGRERLPDLVCEYGWWWACEVLRGSMAMPGRAAVGADAEGGRSTRGRSPPAKRA